MLIIVTNAVSSLTFEYIHVITGNSQEALENVLDSCLLTDEEFKEYEEAAATGSDLNLRKLYFPQAQ